MPTGTAAPASAAPDSRPKSGQDSSLRSAETSSTAPPKASPEAMFCLRPTAVIPSSPARNA